jgi:large subunit ribosomal protein L24
MKVRIRKGDNVEVVSGKDKGERGEVIKVLPQRSQVTVQRVNLRRKHQRQVQTQGRTINPGIVEFEGGIHISNVMLICPKCDQPTRVAIRREDGEVTRVCKQCDADID